MSVYESKQRLARVRKRKRNASVAAMTDPSQKAIALQLAAEERELQRRIAKESAEQRRTADRQRQEDSARFTHVADELRALGAEGDELLARFVAWADEFRMLDRELRRLTAPHVDRSTLIALNKVLTENEFAVALRHVERHFDGVERAVPTISDRVNVQTGMMAKLVRHTLIVDLEEK